MKSHHVNPVAQRAFALQVVQTLRDAGFESFWAGGCVRDDLLGLTPDDYDVATAATPEQVINLFGKRRTVPVGVSFGVVMVLGPEKQAGQVEVATFRADGEYLDGRRPSAVEFCSAEEDAKRRDFTINGMFFDPLSEKVIDYVGGRSDLESRTLRAIGNAIDRFTEDKLRMLRAIRFGATYDLILDRSTADAIRKLCQEIRQVSAERIAQELRRMLAHASRGLSFRRMQETGLAEVLFSPSSSEEFHVRSRLLGALQQPRFEPSLAILFDGKRERENFDGIPDRDHLRDACRKLKLANSETDCICWIAENAGRCRQQTKLPLHLKKPILAHDWAPLLLDVLRAEDLAFDRPPVLATELQRYLDETPADVLSPLPLINGGDVQQLGVKPGPEFARLLSTIRRRQLDEQIDSREQALQELRSLVDISPT